MGISVDAGCSAGKDTTILDYIKAKKDNIYTLLIKSELFEKYLKRVGISKENTARLYENKEAGYVVFQAIVDLKSKIAKAIEEDILNKNSIDEAGFLSLYQNI